MAMSTMTSNSVSTIRLSTIRAKQQVMIDHINFKTTCSNPVTRVAASISSFLHLQNIEIHPRTNFSESMELLTSEEKQSAPTMSPKEDISEKWRELHGAKDWENLLDPLHPWLRREIVKYGEFAQATYDAFDFDSCSEYCGSCRYNPNKIFEKLGLNRHGYNVTKYIYAMSHMNLPRWLERSHLADTWSKDSNWMGYVAISDDKETQRIGRRDIVVAWRGTVAPSEWYEDFQRKLVPIVGEGDHDHEAKVEQGFHSIYKSKSDTTRYNKSSASEQVMKEVTRLLHLYKQKGEQAISLTITGHSLGGALALLNAYEAATTFPCLPISVISFGAPRVGNIAFRDELQSKGVRALRVVIKQDIVHRMPGFILNNESLQEFNEVTGAILDGIYTHVGKELKLDVQSSPYLKHGFNLVGFHSLETYLHLIDGYHSWRSTFRSEAKRDVALVNKACDMLVEELRIPRCWYQLANKGLICNEQGRWVKPRRFPEDMPSPLTNKEAVGPECQIAASAAINFAFVLEPELCLII